MGEVFKHISGHIVYVDYFEKGSLYGKYWGIKLSDTIIMFRIKNIHKKPENRINRLIYLSMLHHINIYTSTLEIFNKLNVNVKLIKETKFDTSLLPAIVILAIRI